MRYILALAFVVCLSVSAFAQELVTVVASLPQQQRQGSFQTGSYTVPLDAVGDVRIRLNISTADYDKVGHKLYYRIYVFDSVSGIWKVYLGGAWISGHVEDPELGTNPAPSVSTNMEQLRGRLVRGEIDLPTRVRVGATVEVVTTP